MKRFFVILAVIGLIMLAMGPISAHAALAVGTAITIDPDHGNDTPGNWSLGWAFVPRKDMYVTALGTYNATGTLSSNHPVGIFALGNYSPVVSTTVLAGTPAVDHWSWNELSTPYVKLFADQTYLIASVTDGDLWTTVPLSLTYNGQINFLGPVYTSSNGSLVYPSVAYYEQAPGFPAFFGPDFKFEYQNTPPPVPTPIPGALWLLGPGLIGVAGLRRRFSK
jgi:hypothetical protein